MKVAISSTGTDLESPVDERFGRARYFLIADSDTGEFEVVNNEVNLNAMQGAGVQSAQVVADQKVEWVLTGHMGPKAFRALNAAGINIATGVSGSGREALDRFKSGEFSASSGPDVRGHW